MTVQLEHVDFRYPGASTLALHDVSLQIAPRQVTLLTGRNGAGCSTLLLVIGALAPSVTGGELFGGVEVLGQDLTGATARTTLAGRIGLLLPTPSMQLSGLALTVRDEVAFGPANLGWTRPRIVDAVDGALEIVAIGHLAGRDLHTLSGGELQRVMLAGVLAMEPELLLLDEPALELDPTNARSVYELLPQLARKATVVIATTDVDRAASYADHAVVLDRGAIAGEGAPDAVLGGNAFVERRVSTTVAEVVRKAGCDAPYPLTPGAAASRFRR